MANKSKVGMAFIPLYASFLSDPKLARMVSELSIQGVPCDLQKVRGVMTTFWLKVGIHHSDGDIVDQEHNLANTIAQLAEWTDPPRILMEVMESVGFIDKTPFGYRVHNWAEKWAKNWVRVRNLNITDRQRELARRRQQIHRQKQQEQMKFLSEKAGVKYDASPQKTAQKTPTFISPHTPVTNAPSPVSHASVTPNVTDVTLMSRRDTSVTENVTHDQNEKMSVTERDSFFEQRKQNIYNDFDDTYKRDTNDLSRVSHAVTNARHALVTGKEYKRKEDNKVIKAASNTTDAANCNDLWTALTKQKTGDPPTERDVGFLRKIFSDFRKKGETNETIATCIQNWFDSMWPFVASKYKFLPAGFRHEFERLKSGPLVTFKPPGGPPLEQADQDLIDRILEFTQSPKSVAYYQSAIKTLGRGIVEEELGETRYRKNLGEVDNPARYLTELLKKQMDRRLNGNFDKSGAYETDGGDDFGKAGVTAGLEGKATPE